MGKLVTPEGGMEEVRPLDGKEWTLAELYAHLKCDCVEVVYGGPGLRPGEVLVVDEEGLFKPSPRVNFLASAIVGKRIVGRALRTTREEMGG